MPKQNEVVEPNVDNTTEPTTETSTPKENETPAGGVNPSEEVPTESIKTETVENDNKIKEQVNNLNIALKQEREEARKKQEEFERKLAKANSITEKLKQAFSDPKEETSAETNNVDVDQLKESLSTELEQKIISELEQKQIAKEQAMRYQTEIKELETKWDGKDGKLKYDDAEVLAWQQANNKVYLSPRDAFEQMNRAEIIDYEVKQRLAKANPVENVEKPATSPGTHEPDKPDNSNIDTRKAIMEAMDAADKEM